MALKPINSKTESVTKIKKEEVAPDLTKIKSYTLKESTIERLSRYKESINERSESFLVQNIINDYLESKGF